MKILDNLNYNTEQPNDLNERYRGVHRLTKYEKW